MRFNCLALLGALALTLAPLLPASPPVILDAADEHHLALALRALKMTPTDPGFKKDVADSEFVPGHVRRGLADPLSLTRLAGDLLAETHQANSLAAIARANGRLVEWTDTTTARDEPGLAVDPAFLAQLPPAAARAVERIAAVVPSVIARLDRALPAEPTAALSAWALTSLSLTTDDAELADWERQGIDPTLLRQLLVRQAALELDDDEPARYLLAAGRGGLSRAIQEAFELLATAVDAAIIELREPTGQAEFQLVTETPHGKIIVGGAGPNVYRDDALLIIDLGGADVYENSAGGALGLAGRPVAVVIDVSGNDRYVARGSFAHGAGVFGIGILADLAGDDVYEAKHLAQGAAFWGAGLLADFGGTDRFEADTHVQGAATFGSGILWQRGGDTQSTARYLAQGFGGVLGAGLLLDAAGNDVYHATGGEPCPWIPGHHFTLAQGFGHGLRPFAGGGVGALLDLAGDDRYTADVYGQGASYWYATGLLLDVAGDDTYDARQYCQGAGIHLSNGLLWDGAGNDRYTAHAICQGGAHDYSVGLLIDRAGDDRYEATSTAQGGAIHNSFALLLDRAGADHYIGHDRDQSQASGHDGGRRQYGSIGLLLDLAGVDEYSQGHTNNALWLKPFYGAGVDVEAPATVTGQASRWPARPPPAVPAVEPLTFQRADPRHPIERLLRVALSSQPDAKDASDQLKEQGAPALDYLLTRLDTPSVAVRVTIEGLIDHLGEAAVPSLLNALATAANEDVARACCYFLARFPMATAAIPHILPLLQRERSQGIALYTLGQWGARAAVGPALRLLRDDREVVRLRAAQALGRAGDIRAAPALVTALEDEWWSVRYAAQDALVALGPRSVPLLRDAFGGAATPTARRHIAEALAKLDYHRAAALRELAWRGEDRLIREARGVGR